MRFQFWLFKDRFLFSPTILHTTQNKLPEFLSSQTAAQTSAKWSPGQNRKMKIFLKKKTRHLGENRNRTCLLENRGKHCIRIMISRQNQTNHGCGNCNRSESSLDRHMAGANAFCLWSMPNTKNEKHKNRSLSFFLSSSKNCEKKTGTMIGRGADNTKDKHRSLSILGSQNFILQHRTN